MRRGTRRSGVRITAALFGALALIISLPAGSGASAGPSFTATGCREAGSFFFVDPSTVETFVPEDFVVEPVVGDLAEVLVLTTSCTDVAAGKSSGPVVFSEVGVYVADVDNSPGWHYYGLWHATNHKQLRAGLAKLGVDAPLVPDISMSSTTGLVDADARVPWSKAPYEMQLVTPVATRAFGSRGSTWWYKARKGYVRIVYDVKQSGGRSGTGQFRTAAGSALAEILGTSTRPIDNAMIVDYSELKATVARVKI
jgi:hypothetical protein